MSAETSRDAARRQTPAGGEIFLDHIAWMAPDMEAASVALERLGLTLTPYSVHHHVEPASGRTVPVGTANRLAMLPLGYLEVLTPHGPPATPVARHLQACLDRHTGVHLAAFTVADAQTTARALEAKGFRMQPPMQLRRTIEAENGRDVEVAFSVSRPAFEYFPEGRIQVLTHHTPEHMWQQRYLPRSGLYDALVEVGIVVEDPAEAADRFARFLSRPARDCGEGKSIRLDRGAVTLMTRENAERALGTTMLPAGPSIARITLTSSDVAGLARALSARGLHPSETVSGHLLVDAAEALGVHIVIRPA